MGLQYPVRHRLLVEKRCTIIRFDPDKDVTQIADHLVPECDSLAEWLAAWLDGENLWDRAGRD